MVKKVILALLCIGVFTAAWANEFLRVKVLSQNVKPGDTVIVEIASDYEIKEAALINGSWRLPCFKYQDKWLCAIGIPTDFKDKENLFIVPLDVKTELYPHTKIVWPLGREMNSVFLIVSLQRDNVIGEQYRNVIPRHNVIIILGRLF